MSVPLTLGERFVDHSRPKVQTGAKKIPLPWDLEAKSKFAPKPKSAFIKAKLAMGAGKRKAESMDPDECAGKGI
jgi:hypothetical protein